MLRGFANEVVIHAGRAFLRLLEAQR